MFSHLHTHSCFSFLEGIIPPADLARAAAERGMPAIALTDHLSLSGALVFFSACKDQGIKPILGLEIDLLLPYRLSTSPLPTITGALVLLAADCEGWNNLCRISSAILTRREDEPQHASLDLLAEHARGLLCLTGGCRGAAQRMIETEEGSGEAAALLGRLGDIFPGRLYVELNAQGPDSARCTSSLVGIAQRMHLPTAAAHNVFYLTSEQASLQRTAAAIRCIQPVTALAEAQVAPPDAYFRSEAEMQAHFGDQPEALRRVEEIVERCSVDLELGKPHYPVLPLPEGVSAIDLLRHKAETGVRALYGPEVSAEVSQRLEQELSTIAARGYEPIFLIASEMLAYARQNGIPSASRGSASSSLVAHCTGITTPDPLALDLYFERFLNPARATPPDIDTDFCSRRRDDVIRHLFETYGADRVAMVGTLNTFRPRSALSEVAKARGLKPQEIRALVDRLGHRWWRRGEDWRRSEDPDAPTPAVGLSTGPAGPFGELIVQNAGNPRVLDILREATAFLGLPHHLSVHPGGVVIAPGPITDFVPVARSGGKGVTITQFDLDDVERAGLVKLDLLGIRGLTVSGDVAASIHSWRRKEFKSALDVLEAVPPDDPDTATLVREGRTVGCFQIESPGMRATLKDIQARSIPDIIAALALYRPGPLKGGLRDAFVRRYKRLEPVTHLHPALSDLLRETYGVILYQEQVLRIAHELAGFSLAEADLLRRAMSHFDPGKQMQVLKEKFIAGAEARRNVPLEIGERIWEMMAAFAGYGFPKAHAASYAVVGWRSAWCKAHYPAEFIAAVLANWGGYYPQSVYLNEARRLKLPVRPPHINHAHQQFSVSYPKGDPVLYMGLDQVRDLTRRTQERIIRGRPFHSLADFILKVDPHMQEAENLIQVGALEGIGAIPDLLRELAAGRPRPGQLTLFPLNSPSGEDWSLEERVDAQQRLLGAGLDAHPLELVADQLAGQGVISTVEAASRIGEKVVVAGVREMYRRNLTAHNAWMAFLTVEDLEGTLDAVLFPDVFRRARNALSVGMNTPLMLEGVMERDAGSGEAVLHVERVQKIEPQRRKDAKEKR